MSAHPTHAPIHADDGLHSHGDTHGHGTRKGYLIGFLLSVLLTAVPFWLVMDHVIDSLGATALIIFGLAVVQIVVHVVFFLHVDARAEGGWTLMTFVFTVLIIGIVIGGSVWVMYHLNTNLMPSMAPDMTQAP